MTAQEQQDETMLQWKPRTPAQVREDKALLDRLLQQPERHSLPHTPRSHAHNRKAIISSRSRCAMETSGRQLWKLLRPAVIATGPLKVLRRMGADGYLYDRIPQVVERWGAKRVLKRLGVDENTIDVADAALERLVDLATSGKRLSLSTRDSANRVALGVLDACAKLPEDNPGATLAGNVVEVIGSRVASMEFDSGVPGSGQGLAAWRVQKKIVVTGDEIGAFAICNNLGDLLAWWVRDWEYADIKCSGVKASFIQALGMVSSNDSDADRSMRINGRWWKRRGAVPET